VLVLGVNRGVLFGDVELERSEFLFDLGELSC
jgi:hypothetical protein